MRETLTPPHSDEAEHSLLGAMLMAPEAIEAVADVLTPAHLYQPLHRGIVSTILKLFIANKAVDVVTVHQAGGHDLGYLNDMVMGCPSAAHARRYAEIVVECWRERELMRIGCDIAEDAVRPPGGKTVAERVDKGVTSLMGILQGEGSGEPEAIASASVRFLDLLDERAQGKEVAIATGLKDWDNLTSGGIRPGELWVIGARPSMGKTALTLTVSRNMAQAHPVLFLSMEDSKDTLVSRYVASLGRVNLAYLRAPAKVPQTAVDEMWSRVSEGVEKLQHLHLMIDDQGGLGLLDVRRKVQQAKRRGGCAVIVIDYLQLMVGEGDNRNLELGRIANGLKAMAKELQVGVILLSQLNRKADERAGLPQVADLRDSGDIEGAVDLIGLLHREHKRNPTEENKHHAQLHVAKQKNGPTDTVNLFFEGTEQRFSDWAGAAPRSGGGKRVSYSGGGMD